MKIPWIPDFKIDWPNHMVSFFSALFGILIAFELDEWRERKKEQEIAMLAYEKLLLEIESNQASLHNCTLINLDLLSTLRNNLFPHLGNRLEFRGPPEKADSINGADGIVLIQTIDTPGRKERVAHIDLGSIIQPVLHFSAWESAKATGALTFLPYEKVQLLSSLYNASRIDDELQKIRLLLRNADEIQNKRDLELLVDELLEALRIIELELQQYDMFANMLRNG